jgi:hypothetical protein
MTQALWGLISYSVGAQMKRDSIAVTKTFAASATLYLSRTYLKIETFDMVVESHTTLSKYIHTHEFWGATLA